MTRRKRNHRQISSRHSLWFGLRRYLIVFDPRTFVLDQWERPWQMLSQKLVFLKSQNFTSSSGIPVPPTVPIHHYSNSETNRNRVRVVFYNPMLTYSKRMLAWNTLIYSKVTAGAHAGPVKDPRRSPAETSEGRVHACARPSLASQSSTTGVLTATTFVYAIGAGITAAAGTGLALQLYSIIILNCSHSNP